MVLPAFVLSQYTKDGHASKNARRLVPALLSQSTTSVDSQQFATTLRQLICNSSHGGEPTCVETRTARLGEPYPYACRLAWGLHAHTKPGQPLQDLTARLSYLHSYVFPLRTGPSAASGSSSPTQNLVPTRGTLTAGADGRGGAGGTHGTSRSFSPPSPPAAAPPVPPPPPDVRSRALTASRSHTSLVSCRQPSTTRAARRGRDSCAGGQSAGVSGWGGTFRVRVAQHARGRPVQSYVSTNGLASSALQK